MANGRGRCASSPSEIPRSISNLTESLVVGRRKCDRRQRQHVRRAGVLRSAGTSPEMTAAATDASPRTAALEACASLGQRARAGPPWAAKALRLLGPERLDRIDPRGSLCRPPFLINHCKQ